MKYRHIAVVVSLALAFAGAFSIGGGCDPCPSCKEHKATGSATPTSTATAIQRSSSGQGLIGIDTNRNVGYVPIYPFDSSGNSQLFVVNLSLTTAPTPTATATAVGAAYEEMAPQAPNQTLPLIKLTAFGPCGPQSPLPCLLSLPGTGENTTVQPIACTFNVITEMIFCAGRQSDSTIDVYQIDAKTKNLVNTIAAPSSVTHDGSFGGIIANPLNNTVLVAGTSSLILLDSSTNPPTFISNSFVDLGSATGGTDSIALNFQTELCVVSSDGSIAVVDFSKTPPVVNPFQNPDRRAGGVFGVTDGVGFDTLTNMLIMTPEFDDRGFAFNFSEVDLGKGTAPNVIVPGLDTTPPVGEGPGGQAVVNGTTHQFVIADEFGQNFKIGQMPLKTITGAPDNNGQPGSGTKADANSVFTIAAALIAQGNVNGTPTQLGIVGDPNSLTMDPALNFAYVLADTNTNFHSWSGGPAGSTMPLFLIRIDLSNPVFGGSSTGTTHWNPDQIVVQMPQ